MKRILIVLGILAVVSSVSVAQLGLNAVGVVAGLVSVSNDVGSGFVIGAGVDLGELMPGIHLRPDLGYWSVTKSSSGVDLKFSDFVINANVVYPINSGGMKSPFYVGGGLGFNSVSSEANVPLLGKVSSSNSRIGINFLGGAGFPISPKMMLHGEARYVLVSDFSHFVIAAGVAFALK
jgi:hypothetical protein